MEEFYFNEGRKVNRFAFERFVEWDEDTFDVYNSSFIKQLNQLPEAGRFIVESDEERIDLISYKIYGDVRYWWMLMEYNEVIERKDIKHGIKLRYFDIRALETLMNRMVIKNNLRKNKKK